MSSSSASATARRGRHAQPARRAERALRRADGAARLDAPGARPRRRGALHRPRRERQGLRRGRGHRGARPLVGDRPLLPAAHRALGRDPRALDAARRGGLRLLPGRRLRAGAGVRPDRRVGEREVRPAGDGSRRAAGRRWNAAADAGRREGARDGRHSQRPVPVGGRSAGGGRSSRESSPRASGSTRRRRSRRRSRPRRRSRRASRRRRSTAPTRARSSSASSTNGACSTSRSLPTTRRRA